MTFQKIAQSLTKPSKTIWHSSLIVSNNTLHLWQFNSLGSGGHKGIPLGINFLKTCSRRHPQQQPATRRQMLLLENNIRQVLDDGCYMVSRWRWTSDVWHSKIRHVPPSKHNRLGFKNQGKLHQKISFISIRLSLSILQFYRADGAKKIDSTLSISHDKNIGTIFYETTIRPLACLMYKVCRRK